MLLLVEFVPCCYFFSNTLVGAVVTKAANDMTSHAIGPYQSEVIQLCLHYAHDATPDSLNLVPALDGLCNLLLTHTLRSSAQSIVVKLPNIDSVSVIESNSSDDTRLMELCVEHGLLFNLRNAMVRFHESPSPTHRCRWLMSGLRGVTAALTLATTTKHEQKRLLPSSTTTTPVKGLSLPTPDTSVSGFSISAYSALNAYNMSIPIFSSVLRKIDISSDANTSEMQIYCHLDIRVKLWKHALRFLAALVVHHSASDMKVWLHQLGDTLVVDGKWKAVLVPDSDKAVKREYRSQLFRGASCSEHVVIRVAAIECLHAMLDKPALRKDVVLAMKLDKKVGGRTQSNSSESNGSLILKIFKVAAMALRVERNDEVVQQLLRIATLFVTHMPLRSISNSIIIEGVALGGIQQDLEEVALVIFRAVLTLAAERQVPTAAGHLAIAWLEQYCKQPNRAQAFLTALSLAYAVQQQTPLESAAWKESFLSPTKKIGASREGSWRKSVSSTATPQIHVIPLPAPASSAAPSTAGGPANFLSTVADMCSTASLGLPGTSIRSLCTLLVGGYPHLQVDSGATEWLGRLLDSYSFSETAALRVQSCKMTTALLSNASASSSIEFSDSVMETLVAARSLQNMLKSLLRACCDPEHLVRASAVGCFGVLPAKLWVVLRTLPFDLLEDLNEQNDSIRTAIVRRLLAASGDAVSTVRAAAFKALGDIILNKGLGPSGDSTMLPSSDSQLIGFIFAATSGDKSGCDDSSLAVRTQAAWLLSNLLQSVLPLRFDILREVESEPAPWLLDDTWRTLHNCAMHILTVDSDKLSATAVRTLGLLTGGLNPHVSHHRELIDKYCTTLMDRFLTGDVASAVQALEGRSQKLAFAACQSLGFMLWGELKWAVEGSNSNGWSKVDDILTFQVAMLRHGKPALQLQAAQILLYFVTSVAEVEGRPPPDVLSNILETVLLIGAVTRRNQPSARQKKTPLEGTVDDSAVEEEEASRLLESRTSALQRYLLLLLWSILRLAVVTYRESSRETAFKALILGQLDDQSRSLTDWLERLSGLEGLAAACCLESDVSLGLPHCRYSTEHDLLRPVDGKRYTVIVSEACGSALELLQMVEHSADMFVSTEHLLASSAPRLEALRDGFARPRASSERGYGLFSGLEPVLSPRPQQPQQQEEERQEDEDEI
eukprot:gene23104-29297_t